MSWVHRHVLLDDRGGIVLGNRVSISDYATSTATRTVSWNRRKHKRPQPCWRMACAYLPRDGACRRRVGEQAMVGACAVATKDVRPYHVNVGIPAKSVRVKPNAPGGSDILFQTRERRTSDGT